MPDTETTGLPHLNRRSSFTGVDQVASDTRSRMQTVQLHSDMSAFKAANPRAVFVDFLRWFVMPAPRFC